VPIDQLNDKDIRHILLETRTIAVVGLSPNPVRPSHTTAQYLIAKGYHVVPVNPNLDNVLGLTCYADLRDIPFSIDMVDLFQRSEVIPEYVAAAASTAARFFWMQLGIVNSEAAKAAKLAGMEVVMDRCTKIEHARLLDTI